MKSLILIFCVALTANAEVVVDSVTEQLRSLATLLQEHHHRISRQVTTSPPTPPTPTTGFSQPACQAATRSFVQNCFLAHGLDVSDLAAQVNSSNSAAFYIQLSEVYCKDGHCRDALLNFYETCIGNEVSGRKLKPCVLGYGLPPSSDYV